MTAENPPDPATDPPPTEPPVDAAADGLDLWVARCVRRYCDGAAPVGEPLAILVAGQPGAGKGAIVESLSRYFVGHGFCVVLDPRELELLHPHYESLCLADEKTASAEVAAEVAEAAEAVFLEAADAKRNLVIETRLDSSDSVADMVLSLASCGYRVVLLLVCTTPEDSWAACEERYEREKADLGFGRWLDADEHDRLFFAMRDALLPFEDQGLFDEARLLTRDGELLLSIRAEDDAEVGVVVDAYDDFLRGAWGEFDEDEGDAGDDAEHEVEAETGAGEGDVDPSVSIPATPEPDAAPPAAPAATTVVNSSGRTFKIIAKPPKPPAAALSSPPPPPASETAGADAKPRGFKINIKKPASAPREPATPPPPPSPAVAPTAVPAPIASPPRVVTPVSRRGDDIAPPTQRPTPREAPPAPVDPTPPPPVSQPAVTPSPAAGTAATVDERAIARRRLWQEKVRKRAGRATDPPP